MAVTKLWPVTVRLKAVLDYTVNPDKTANPKYSLNDYQALRDVLAYANDEEKTEWEFFCEGINCNVMTAREQFITVKEQFDKTDGIQAYHGYMSFKEMDITPEQAQKIGMEFAKTVWGDRFQVVVTTHLNTQHLHCHFVINSVSFVDGLRCRDTSWFKFRKIADCICDKYGIYYNPTPNRSKVSSYYYKLEQAGMKTPHQIMRDDIDYAIVRSRSREDFIYILKQLGYEYQMSDSRKYWTLTPKGRIKAVRLRTLGEDYTNERIMERIFENKNKATVLPFYRHTESSRQYNLQTREHKIRKVGGLRGLYLYYCYRLGYLPKYKPVQSRQIHHRIRDDRIRLEELSTQAMLLSKNHIGTEEQLFIYKQSVEDEIKKLSADRTHLRNEIRKVNITDAELSQAKEKISAITERLKTLRKDVRMCDAIAERSGVMKANLKQVLADEEKSNGKENRNYVQRR